MNDHVVSAPEADAPQTGIVEYTATERGLAELRSRLAGRVYDVTTTKGLTEARKDRAELRDLRVALEKTRKEIKAPALERCRKIDTEAKRITEAILALEDPIDQQIKRREAEQEAARQESERAEAARLAAINAELDAIRTIPMNTIGASAEQLQQVIDTLVADTLERFDEVHLPTAQQIKDDALGVLLRMLAEREALDRQRAELERLAQEQAAREAEAAAQREREDAERRRLQEEEDRRRAEEAAAARAEQERIAAEQAERQRQLDEQAAAQRRAQEEAEARARAEQKAREAAERAERERLAAEAAQQARQQEEDAIQRATLREAAQEAYAVLCELGHADHITTRKLAAALAKEPA